MSHLSTHILDAGTGRPAAEVEVVLRDAGGTVLAHGRTDEDGRLSLGPDRLPDGDYTLRFEVAGHFARTGTSSFYPHVTVAFTVAGLVHYHVPLLLSPFAYTTYRGS